MGGMRANTETGRSSARAGAFYDHVNKLIPIQLQTFFFSNIYPAFLKIRLFGLNQACI